MAKPRTRLDVSQKVLGVGDGYFFFFLPVVFFAFLRFLSHVALRNPKIWFNASRPSTCINTEYTTIAKLILRASKKVNGGHTVRVSLTIRRRDTWTRLVAQLENIRDEIDVGPCRQWQAA